MEINFVTKNPHKAKEVEAILGNIGISIVHAPLTIHEIQRNQWGQSKNSYLMF